MATPLQTDPTRTTTVRKQMASALRGGYRKFVTDLRQSIDGGNTLGFGSDFREGSAQSRVSSFGDVVDRAFASNMESDQLQSRVNTLIFRAYQRGATNAHASLQGVDDLQDIQRSIARQGTFLNQFMGSDRAREQIGLVSARVAESLVKMKSEAREAIARAAIASLSSGATKKQFKKAIQPVLEKLSRRMNLIAQTEIIRAHADAQVSAFDALGVKELGVEVEWTTVGDDRVCPICLSFEGMIFKISEAQGLIPAHPSCRCSWIPAPPRR